MSSLAANAGPSSRHAMLPLERGLRLACLSLERLSVARNTQADNSADQTCGKARENEPSPSVGLVFVCSTSWGAAVGSSPCDPN